MSLYELSFPGYLSRKFTLIMLQIDLGHKNPGRGGKRKHTNGSNSCKTPDGDRFDRPAVVSLRRARETRRRASTVLLRSLENCLLWQAASFSNIDIENEPKSSLVVMRKRENA